VIPNDEQKMRDIAIESFPRTSDRGFQGIVRDLRPQGFPHDLWCHILADWEKRGFYTYNFSVEMGRLTDRGVQEFSEVEDSAACVRCGKPKHRGRCSKAAMAEFNRETANA